MRRALRILIIGMLFAVGSSTTLATTTQTTTIRALIAAGGWENFDEDTGSGETGAIQFATEGGRTAVSLSMSKGELVLCEGGDTPDDPSDDYYGFVGLETYGEGPATLTVGRTYSSATASGKVTADVYSYDECTGDEGTSSTKTISVSLALDGVSPVITEKLRSKISIPKLLRSKTLIQARSRQAAGTATVGSRTLEIDGVIGQLQMKASTTQR